MNDISEAAMVEAALNDHHRRAELHARHCVCCAVVTSEPLAAELIDQAIEFRAAVRHRVRYPSERPLPASC